MTADGLLVLIKKCTADFIMCWWWW